MNDAPSRPAGIDRVRALLRGEAPQPGVVGLLGMAMTAVGRVAHAGRRTAVAEGGVTDAQGCLWATASTMCLVKEHVR
jgi:hypothetical protein